MLLQISAERLATLPQWTPVVYDSEGRQRRGFVDHVRRAIADEGQYPNVGFGCPGLLIWLDLSSLLAAAVVAVKIVRSWLEEQGSRSGRDFGDAEALAEHHWLLSAAMLMQPLTPEQTETLARLARAAMEAA